MSLYYVQDCLRNQKKLVSGKTVRKHLFSIQVFIGKFSFMSLQPKIINVVRFFRPRKQISWRPLSTDFKNGWFQLENIIFDISFACFLLIVSLFLKIPQIILISPLPRCWVLSKVFSSPTIETSIYQPKQSDKIQKYTKVQ